MKGYHKVRVFVFDNGEEVSLPEGWKPFGVADSTGYRTRVVARKWERVEE